MAAYGTKWRNLSRSWIQTFHIYIGKYSLKLFLRKSVRGGQITLGWARSSREPDILLIILFILEK